MSKNYADESLKIHARHKGKLEICAKIKLDDIDDLSMAYTPGIAAISQAIAQDPDKVWNYTWRGNTVAIVSDGSAVLGLGNIGPLAAQPVMAGKALLFKKFANIDGVPIVLDSQDKDQIIQTVKNLAPSFGGINLEDISAPRCFEIEEALQDLGIPVMHDDQHGTAVVVLAGLINACKLINKPLSKMRIVINGAGSAGTAIAKLILKYTNSMTEILILDRKGLLFLGRPDLNPAKMELAKLTNPSKLEGGLSTALKNADIFIGVSAPNILEASMIALMSPQPIVFALANPIPEIDPKVAKEAGAAIVATGRSDYPNQINNVLAFPGIFRGALDSKALRISEAMLVAAATTLAQITNPLSLEHILPSPLEKEVAGSIAQAVATQASKEGNVRKSVTKD